MKCQNHVKFNTNPQIIACYLAVGLWSFSYHVQYQNRLSAKWQTLSVCHCTTWWNILLYHESFIQKNPKLVYVLDFVLNEVRGLTCWTLPPQATLLCAFTNSWVSVGVVRQGHVLLMIEGWPRIWTWRLIYKSRIATWWKLYDCELIFQDWVAILSECFVRAW